MAQMLPETKIMSRLQIEKTEPDFFYPERVTDADFLPLQKLGRGSFGDVYLVRDLIPGSEKLFAMKTLNKRSKLEDSWMRYVKTERDVLANSDCPFIINL